MFIDSKFDTFICKNYKLIMLKFEIILNIWSVEGGKFPSKTQL